MIKRYFNNLPLYTFKNLSEFQNIIHFVTTRRGGVSTGAYSSFNLGFGTEEKEEVILKNRKILADSLEIEPEQLIFQYQIHSDIVETISGPQKSKELCHRDGMMTNVPGLCLCAKGADCVPVLFFDSKKNVIASVHAGWRGVISEIVPKTIIKMSENFGSNPNDIYIGIGPSIGPEDFEVGVEVAKLFNNSFSDVSNVVIQIEEKYFVNLWEAIKIQLIEVGVNSANIEISEISTFSNSDLFYSHRKSGGKTGRFAAGIMLKKI